MILHDDQRVYTSKTTTTNHCQKFFPSNYNYILIIITFTLRLANPPTFFLIELFPLKSCYKKLLFSQQPLIKLYNFYCNEKTYRNCKFWII